MLQNGPMGTNSSRNNAGSPLNTTPALIPADLGPNTLRHGPTPPLIAPPASMRSSSTPTTGISAAPGQSTVMARHAKNIAKETMRRSNNGAKSPRMQYPENAVAPETPEELSIYPIGSRQRRVSAEEVADSVVTRLEPGEEYGPEWNLQHFIKQESDRLWAEKRSKMLDPSTSGMTTVKEPGRLDPNIGFELDGGILEGTSIPVGTIPNTRYVLHESMRWIDVADPDQQDPSTSDRPPGDESLLSEIPEWVLPPWDQPTPPSPPSLSTLSAMPSWAPSLDAAYQTSLLTHLPHSTDMRFQPPQTPTDIASLQHALEMTRMDFWLQSPTETYPADLSRYGHESYASQHRRLQHAFCRVWREYRAETTAPPELFRLPGWMFGFGCGDWTPSSWGVGGRARAYNGVLAEMAGEKREKGLEGVVYREWKGRIAATEGLLDWK